jgi:hypothetical protein
MRPSSVHLHVHDVRVGGQQPVAHLHRGLEADLALLHRHHRLFQADGGVVQAEFLLQALRVHLVAADVLQRIGHRRAEAAAGRLVGFAHQRLLRGQRRAVGPQPGTGNGLVEVEGLEFEFHGWMSTPSL